MRRQRRALVLAACAWPFATIAQKPQKIYRIGFLSGRSGMEPWLEAFRQPDHALVAECLQEATGGLLTTNFVFDEAVTLLRYRLGYAVAAKFGAQLLTGRIATLVAVTRNDETRAWSIFKRYKDKSFSFTDCTSFAVMDRLKIDRAAAIDDDFRTYGKTCIPS